MVLAHLVRRMNFNRRKFLRRSALAAAAAVAAGGAWVALSNRFAARLVRRQIADATRGVLPPPAKPTPSSWSDNAVTVSWVGHATVLINFYGVNILTDPIFAERCGVSLGITTAGPKRFVAPALALAELPRLDLVLLSHAHMDHLDLPTINRVARGVPIITAKATTDLLADTKAKQITELAWDETSTLRTERGELQVEAFEVKHWGKRWPREKIQRGYNGYILRREGRAILFGGDTADTPLFRKLRSRGPFEVALMPIGAYQPWIHAHCTPEQAVNMANDAGARYVVPIHHQTFQLSEEPMGEPIERVQAALQREPERLALQKIGETFVCPTV
jgi:L-ascorbate metabolism protein UlaG (beta-lactamase superfamily)